MRYGASKFFLPPAGGGRGQGEGAADALSGVAHLTLPSRSLSSGRALRGPGGAGPLPLPPEGRRGAFNLPL